MRDVAIVSFAQAPLEQPAGQTETLMLLPTITEALTAVGMSRRQVRRMIEAIGSKVLKLVRTEIGGVPIGDLTIGKYRELTPGEITMLTPHRRR